MKPEEIESIEIVLRDLYRIGKEQMDKGQLTQRPHVSYEGEGQFINIDGSLFPVAMGKIKALTHPTEFLIANIRAYWIAYEAALDILNKPAVRFTVRALLELCYSRIIHFSTFPESDQRQRALKFWLCTDGLIIGSPFRESSSSDLVERYHAALELLESHKEKETFLSLAKRGYPRGSYHSKLQDICTSITDVGLRKKVEAFLVSVWGSTYSIHNLDMHFRHTSMIVHGNPVTMGILSQDKVKSDHILHCAKVLHYTGVTLIRFCEGKLGWRVTRSAALAEIQRNSRQYLYDVWSQGRVRS